VTANPTAILLIIIKIPLFRKKQKPKPKIRFDAFIQVFERLIAAKKNYLRRD